MQDLTIAVVGATGAVGAEFLRIVETRYPTLPNLKLLASSRSAGKTITVGGQALVVGEATVNSFNDVDVAFISASSAVSHELAPAAVAAGAVVIDDGSAFRMEDKVPLVVPEVNPEAIADYKKRGIIANPNCSTIQMVMVLKPLHDIARIKRVVVATYQSVSGSGKVAMDELFNQTRGIFVNEPVQQHQEEFTKQIAFNVIPHIDIFMDDGLTKEEWKMAAETNKILDPDIRMTATCVRVPVFIGHAEAINIEFAKPITEDQAREALRAAPGVSVIDNRVDEGYVTPAECAGEDAVFVSRIRCDPTIENGLNIWCVSDNLRKGAALNTVQIAEELIRSHMQKAA